MDGSVCVHGGIEYYLVRCGRDSYIGIHYLSCDDMDQINPRLESDGWQMAAGTSWICSATRDWLKP